jgi:nucleotide-binding universal stress UspA family protein
VIEETRWSVYERIVVPLDGSDLAESVLAQVRRLLFHKDAEVILVRAVSVPPSVEAEAIELPDILQAQATKYLGAIAADLISQGARVRTVTRTGYAADVILDVAIEEKASLIVLSTHGRTGMARWALGSVAEKVLRASRVPVLAVRSFVGSARAATAELTLQTILVPIDATDLSLEVVPPTLELAKLFGSHVVLLNVCEAPECTIPVSQISEAYERFHAAGVSVEPLMKQGDAAAQILDTCSGYRADLIAMTTHGRAGLTRWMLGSVTEKVLRASTVPLLVVRPAKAMSKPKGHSRKAQAIKA